MAERIKFYTDEHVAKAVVAGLRRRGVDVLTAPEAGLHPAADEEHLELAVQQGRVIFTQDADFCVCTRPAYAIVAWLTRHNIHPLDKFCGA